MKKTVKRMKKDLELRSKYVFEAEGGDEEGEVVPVVSFGILTTGAQAHSRLYYLVCHG